MLSTIKPYALAYAATAVVFVGLDFIWLSQMGQTFYRRILGDMAVAGFSEAELDTTQKETSCWSAITPSPRRGDESSGKYPRFRTRFLPRRRWERVPVAVVMPFAMRRITLPSGEDTRPISLTS